MLFFSRWKVAAILLTAVIVCLFAVPNFFSENTLRHWPSWAQRHIVLGLDLQGGSSLLLEVDVNSVRQDRLQSISEDVLRLLTVRVDALEEGPSAMLQSRARDDRDRPRRGDRDDRDRGDRGDRPRRDRNDGFGAPAPEGERA